MEQKTLNDLLFDATLRHQVSLRRYTKAQVKKILAMLEKADADLAQKLRKHLIEIAGKPIDLKGRRMQAIIKDIHVMRDEISIQLEKQTVEDLRKLAEVESTHEHKLLVELLPVEFSVASVTAEAVFAAVVDRPFAQGKTLSQWFETLRTYDQTKLIETIQLGLVQGQTVDDMVRTVVGTKKNNYADGILAITRRNAEAVVRTGINHVSNAAREQIWQANDSLIFALRWTSTLDGRTSAICRSRDGALAPVGNNVLPKDAKVLEPSGARPPAHPNCRSVIIAVLSADGIADSLGDRPFVSDTRTRKQREIDFRAEAKTAMGDKWKTMSVADRNDVIKSIKRDWTAKNVGQVPSVTTYDKWLRNQSKQFQEDVLGVKKAQLYRSGKLKLDEFVDHSGRELTLDELAKLHPEAFGV